MVIFNFFKMAAVHQLDLWAHFWTTHKEYLEGVLYHCGNFCLNHYSSVGNTAERYTTCDDYLQSLAAHQRMAYIFPQYCFQAVDLSRHSLMDHHKIYMQLFCSVVKP